MIQVSRDESVCSSTRSKKCDSMNANVGLKLRGTCFKIDDKWIGSLLLTGLPDGCYKNEISGYEEWRR